MIRVARAFKVLPKDVREIEYFEFLDILEDLATVPDVDDTVFALAGGGSGKKSGKTIPLGTTRAERAAAIAEITRRKAE